MMASASASSPNRVSGGVSTSCARLSSSAGSLYGICERRARKRPRTMFLRLFLSTNSLYSMPSRASLAASTRFICVGLPLMMQIRWPWWRLSERKRARAPGKACLSWAVSIAALTRSPKLSNSLFR